MQNLINRYNDIADIFPEDLRGDALPYFLDWLTEKVMRVEITAFSDDDAYTIFETMNDRGLSLTPTDMLKGYLLANITDDLMTDYGGRIKIDNLSSTHNGLVDYSAFFTVFGGEVLSAADVDELEIADRAGDTD